MATAIKAENLSKIYRLGEIGTGTISRDIERWLRMNVLRQDDPFLRIGECNDRSKKGSSDIVYSLRDINFEIEQGDAIGIIGRNGAGKSTLLKILSRVTAPSTGRIKLEGRVASLLEVGTGFHPELTGRENIYLNGAIQGMRRKEIDRKLDEIIDFSGVERYIDTPVKRYSSGMYVRLAFAVAAHLESEILIVDEVLAVGDAEFQKKCLGKMGEVSKGEGRTVLFVSHNMASIESLCFKGILLVNGGMFKYDKISNIISFYSDSRSLNNDIKISEKERTGFGRVKITHFKILNQDVIKAGNDVCFEISYDSIEESPDIVEVGLSIWTLNQVKLISISSEFKCQIKKFMKTDNLICTIKSLPLIDGDYQVNFFISSIYGIEDYILNICNLKIENSNYYNTGKMPNPNWGIIPVDHNWVKKK